MSDNDGGNDVSEGAPDVNDGDIEATKSTVVRRDDDSEGSAMKWEGNLDDFPLKTFSRPIGDSETLKILVNPIVFIISTLLLWGLSIVCMLEPTASSAILSATRASITEMFTWFYVGLNPFMLCFILCIAYRFGDVKLGQKDSSPEFTDFEYFSMLFSAGIGVGLFFYGVSEPLSHQHGNWYANGGYQSQDERDMFAINLTVFHWGFTGWSAYLIVAICCGLASFRFKLPMTLRSCFYPLLGEYVWGYIGDCIDALSIIATITGVCTSLGLGAYQLAAGLERVGALDPNQDDDARTNLLVIEIWVVTAFATCSVVSGLDAGIKWLSTIGLALGVLLQSLVFCLDKTSYMLNLMVQEVGYYIRVSIFTLNFQTDAFGQLSEGVGRATDGKAADKSFMNSWTLFYIGWWISWSAFVGLFIARISKGRTIRNITFYSYAIPLGYAIMWFSIFGGVGLRQARQAEELKIIGADVYGNSSHYVNDDISYCYDVPQEDVVAPNGTVVFQNSLIGVTPVCSFNPAQSDMAWFNVLYSYSYPLDFTNGFGPTLAWISLFSLTIYFVTSSDSGSLVVDTIASGGYMYTHWSQRVYWAITEGALATALLLSGGTDGLNAVQAASIITGLPFSFMLCFMCVSIFKLCKLAEFDDKLENGKPVQTLKEHYYATRIFKQPIYGGVLNVIEYILMCGISIHEERKEIMPYPTTNEWMNFFMAAFVPFVPYYKIVSRINPKPFSKKSNIIFTCLYAITFYSWIALFACTSVSVGFNAFGWCTWIINAMFLASLRLSVRGMFNIDGNLFWDILTSIFLWPQVFCQLLVETQNYDSHTNYDDTFEQSTPPREESFDDNSSNVAEA